MLFELIAQEQRVISLSDSNNSSNSTLTYNVVSRSSGHWQGHGAHVQKCIITDKSMAVES